MPAEFWVSKERNMTFLMVRSGTTGTMRSFCDELVSFINEVDFANVAILTSTMNPIQRERKSSTQIPEVFAYCNNFLYKSTSDFYKQNGIRKFGYWIQETKTEAHMELRELEGAGWAARLMKSFNRMDKPAAIFTIFCTGDIDFVGGYVFYHFL